MDILFNVWFSFGGHSNGTQLVGDGDLGVAVFVNKFLIAECGAAV